MTGDGLGPDAHVRVGLPCPRPGGGRLVIIGCRPEEPADVAADRLAGVDVVFVDGPSEAVVLFYAEAWRVERLDGAARVAAWFLANPCGTAALVAPGDAGTHPLLDDLRLLLPDLPVDRDPGLTVGPPPRLRLGGPPE